MLKIVEQPSSPTWSRNRVAYKFLSTDAFGRSFAGRGVWGQLCFSRYIADPFFRDGDALIIEWTDGVKTYGVTLIAKDTPVGTNEFQAYRSDWTLLRLMYELVYTLRTQPVLSTFFDIDIGVSAPCIDIRSKEINAAWELDIRYQAVAMGLSTNLYNDIVEDATPDNYKVLLEVFFQDDYPFGGYRRVAVLEDTIDGNGCTVFDLQDILDSEFQCSYTQPPLAPVCFEAPYIADNIRCYYLRYSERYGTPVEQQDCVYTAARKVICGGIDTKLFDKTNLLGDLSEENSFLSWYPSGKTVSPEQSEHLHWYNYTGDTVQTYLKVECWDGTHASPNSIVSVFQANELEVDTGHTITFPAGFDQLGLLDCKRYSVQVMNLEDDTALSQVRYYIVDCYCHECLCYLVYINGFCLPETLRLTGQTKKNLTVDRQFVSAHTSSGILAKQWCFDWENPLQFRTGYLSKKEVDALQEMLIYNEVYKVEDNDYCQYLINTKKFDITECLQFLHELDFQAVRSLQPVNYSNDCLIIEECCCDDTIAFAGNSIEFGNLLIQFENEECCCGLVVGNNLSLTLGGQQISL